MLRISIAILTAWLMATSLPAQQACTPARTALVLSGGGAKGLAHIGLLRALDSVGVRPDLVRAVIHAESAFNPMARSIKGAMGLMQLMPATAIAYGVSNAYDPVQNIRAGVAYLRSLLERYSQNEELALAAYNAGPTAVKKYGDAVPPYRETRNYVAKIRKEAGARPAPTRVYKVVEFQDGREIIRYTNTPPSNKPDAVNAAIR